MAIAPEKAPMEPKREGRMAGNLEIAFAATLLRGRSGCASHGHVGMPPGMVADFEGSATRLTSAGCRVTRITGDGRRLPGSNEVPPDDRTVGGCRSSVL